MEQEDRLEILEGFLEDEELSDEEKAGWEEIKRMILQTSEVE